jgi:hypothetical protein
MRHLLAVLFFGLLMLAAVGCQNKTGDSAAMADACPHCEGVQKMTTEGKCEKCGMTADGCSHCSGVQTLTADGKCPVCGMKMANK